MDNIVGYLNYNSTINKNNFPKIFNKIFFKVSINNFEKNKIELLVNKNKINFKRLNKIKNIAKEKQINKIVVSKKIKFENEYPEIDTFTGKFLMKNIIIYILKYIYETQKKDIRCENLHILIDNDKQNEIIFDLAKEFKCISIVTDNIKKLKRLSKKLDDYNDIIYSISNNYKKSLKTADVIVNFDYDSKFFSKFNINRNSIIINLNENSLKLKNSYQGMIIENIDINYKKIVHNILDINDFDKNIFYESYMYNFKYHEIKDEYIKNNCMINYLIGNNGKITIKELQNTEKNLKKA